MSSKSWWYEFFPSNFSWVQSKLGKFGRFRRASCEECNHKTPSETPIEILSILYSSTTSFFWHRSRQTSKSWAYREMEYFLCKFLSLSANEEIWFWPDWSLSYSKQCIFEWLASKWSIFSWTAQFCREFLLSILAKRSEVVSPRICWLGEYLQLVASPIYDCAQGADFITSGFYQNCRVSFGDCRCQIICNCSWKALAPQLFAWNHWKIFFRIDSLSRCRFDWYLRTRPESSRQANFADPNLSRCQGYYLQDFVAFACSEFSGSRVSHSSWRRLLNCCWLNWSWPWNLECSWSFSCPEDAPYSDSEYIANLAMTCACLLEKQDCLPPRADSCGLQYHSWALIAASAYFLLAYLASWFFSFVTFSSFSPDQSILVCSALLAQFEAERCRLWGQCSGLENGTAHSSTYYQGWYSWMSFHWFEVYWCQRLVDVEDLLGAQLRIATEDSDWSTLWFDSSGLMLNCTSISPSASKCSINFHKPTWQSHSRFDSGSWVSSASPIIFCRH